MAESVIVVTGLPRSGTSMVMQMLAAGGVAVLADDERLPDENNPRGYLEYEPAKRIVSDASWVETARGQAVKIVAPLVRHLPRGESAPPYLVVHMRRPIDEVVASQRTMLTPARPQGRRHARRGLGGDLRPQQVTEPARSSPTSSRPAGPRCSTSTTTTPWPTRRPPPAGLRRFGGVRILLVRCRGGSGRGRCRVAPHPAVIGCRPDHAAGSERAEWLHPCVPIAPPTGYGQARNPELPDGAAADR